MHVKGPANASKDAYKRKHYQLQMRVAGGSTRAPVLLCGKCFSSLVRAMPCCSSVITSLNCVLERHTDARTHTILCSNQSKSFTVFIQEQQVHASCSLLLSI